MLAIIIYITHFFTITILQFTALDIELEGSNSLLLLVLEHSDCSGVIDSLDDSVRWSLLDKSNLHGCPILVAHSIHQFISLLHSLIQAVFDPIDQPQQFLLGL